MRAHFGGPPDPYYRPTQSVIANPGLNLSGTYKILNHLPPAPSERNAWEAMPPCIQFKNDTQLMGLLPLFSRYATQMTENDISIRSAQINLRQQTVISAADGQELESAQAYIESLEAGKISVIGQRPFLEGIKVNNANTGQSNVIMQLIELQQYLKASWYNEIGLNSNFNMKRQYISSDEVQASADIMLPLIDNMYECRKEAVDLINKHFGTNITVEKDSAWEKKQIQSDLAIQPEEVEESLVKSGPDSGADSTAPESTVETIPENNENSPAEKLVSAIEDVVQEVIEGEGGEENDKEEKSS